MSRSRRPPPGEDGAALIIALVVLTSFALVIGSLLSLGGSSLIASSALRYQRSQIYASEAAMDEAITNLRTTPSCDGFDGFAPPRYEIPKATPVLVTIRCSGGDDGNYILSALIGSQRTLQARVHIDPAAKTATVQSWDETHELFTPPGRD